MGISKNEAIKNLEMLEGIISYEFNNKEILLQAMTHTSFLHEILDWPVPSFQRLEFLGDAILQLVITEMLLNTYPLDNEGSLSKKRAMIVEQDSLVRIAKILNLEKFILLGKSEHNRLEISKSILSDFVESLVAAIYLDGGFDTVNGFCQRYFQKVVEEVERLKDDYNYKSNLQNFVQTHYHVLPDYRVIDERGPEHKKKYTVGVFINSKELAVATGFSKKQAEQKAARKAYEKVTKEEKTNV